MPTSADGYPEPETYGETVADFRHVGATEAIEGTDDPEPVDLPDEEPEPTFKPTRKWIAARITGLAAILTMFVLTGTWNAEESVALIGLLTEGFVSWRTPNDATPGGVPVEYGD